MTDDRCRRAAAVCYRVRDGRIEFLLVRTKNGTYWTFPKGHVEPGESGAAAARREAGEEAGVTGRVVEPAVATYAYPASGACDEVIVDAFLMEVQGTTGEAEPQRDPTWFDPDAAAAALARGRPERYVRAQEDAVARARDALERGA